MKIKIIGSGKHRISNDTLIFNTKECEIEIDIQSAKEITWTLLDVLYFSDTEMHEIMDKIEDKIDERR